MKKKWILMIFSILIIVALAACNDKDNEKGSPNENTNEEVPEADLEGIPNVVIEINGEEVTKDEFSNMYEQQIQQQFMQSKNKGKDNNYIDQEQLNNYTA